jgi:hypothetical protein
MIPFFFFFFFFFFLEDTGYSPNVELEILRGEFYILQVHIEVIKRHGTACIGGGRGR